ncbi:helix-turn-helix domain-containing protein [Bacillus paramobilis]|uniref:helix-turn-helix domain-containing protein n=1 Tax=Bacillus paramobilis TaxID=2817477 RepID=UPI001BB3DCE9|nr:helix-turn-helix transcriptional regulator [Bacillus paramobilis]HEF5065784.1 helix-turn-helix domain-containing protein [Bacillus cereus]HEF5237768.1 helix-turn-helix domain-containing protein [Bacillus cereus]
MENQDSKMRINLNVERHSNDLIKENIQAFPDVQLKVNLDKLMNRYSLTLKEVALLTGLRTATVSNIKNMKMTTLNIAQILLLVKALRITDLGELIELEMEEETRERFTEERAEMDRRNTLTEEMEDTIRANEGRRYIQK